MLLYHHRHRAFLIVLGGFLIIGIIELLILLLHRPYLVILSTDQRQIQLYLANFVKHLAYLLILLLLLHLSHAFLLYLLRCGNFVPLRNGRVGHNDL